MRAQLARRGPQAAAVSVEFAIALPIVLLLVLGMIESARLIWMQITLDYVVQSTARCLAVGYGKAGAPCGTASQAQQYASNSAAGLSIPPDQFAVAAPVAGCGAQVTVSWSFESVVPSLLPFAPVITATACYPI